MSNGFTVDIPYNGSADFASLLNQMFGGALPITNTLTPGQEPVEDFSSIKASPKIANKYLTEYKDIIEDKMTQTIGTPEHNDVCMKYYNLLLDVYGYNKTEIIEALVKQNYVPALSKFALHNFNTRNDAVAMEYFIKCAEHNCDDNPSHPLQILIETKSDDISAMISKYYDILFKNVKNPIVCKYVMIYHVLIGNYDIARFVYQETKKVCDIQPIDISVECGSKLANQVIYGSQNIFAKDDITNKYINKLNSPGFKQIGDCFICLDENVDLIPFDCTHRVCAYKCYPKIMMAKKKECPVCKAKV